MDSQTRSIIRDCANASLERRVTFAEVMQKLIAAGVERYHADYVRGETCYYTADGDFEAVATLNGKIADIFSAEAMQAAVRGAQSGALAYPEFSAKAMAAGCAGYFVLMTGGRVIYYGRKGDMHIEWFPGAQP